MFQQVSAVRGLSCSLLLLLSLSIHICHMHDAEDTLSLSLHLSYQQLIEQPFWLFTILSVCGLELYKFPWGWRIIHPFARSPPLLYSPQGLPLSVSLDAPPLVPPWSGLLSGSLSFSFCCCFYFAPKFSLFSVGSSLHISSESVIQFFFLSGPTSSHSLGMPCCGDNTISHTLGKTNGG